MRHSLFALLFAALTLSGFTTTLQAKTFTTDVAVIGAGGAGLAAALEAKLLGADVMVFEKMPHVGGNTILASGGMNVPASPFVTVAQRSKGAEISAFDTVDIAYADTMKAGEWKNNPSLALLLNREALTTLEWLMALGADFRETALTSDATKARLHRPKSGRFAGLAGPEIIRTLYREAHARNVDIRTATTVLSLSRDASGRVTTLKIKDAEGTHTVTARAVVNAAGGFAASKKMTERAAPRLSRLASTNHAGATGDGIRLAERLGADTVALDAVEIEPTISKKTARIIPEALRRKGAILINTRGERFVNELADDLSVATAMRRQKNHRAFLFLNETVYKTLNSAADPTEIETIVMGNTLEDIAKKTRLPLESLQKTLKSWQDAKDRGEDTFGRRSFPWSLSSGPYYLLEVVPARHYTPGGLKIDETARVLNKSGKPIPGLFAAGEVTGGVHGRRHLVGNALTDAIVFGRIAGREAYVDALRQKTKEENRP